MRWRWAGTLPTTGKEDMKRDTGFWPNIDRDVLCYHEVEGGGVVGHFQQLVRRTLRETPASGRILIVMCCYNEVEVCWDTSYSW